MPGQGKRPEHSINFPIWRLEWKEAGKKQAVRARKVPVAILLLSTLTLLIKTQAEM